MRQGLTLIKKKIDLNTANDEASAKASPFLRKTTSILAMLYGQFV